MITSSQQAAAEPSRVIRHGPRPVLVENRPSIIHKYSKIRVSRQIVRHVFSRFRHKSTCPIIPDIRKGRRRNHSERASLLPRFNLSGRIPRSQRIYAKSRLCRQRQTHLHTMFIRLHPATIPSPPHPLPTNTARHKKRAGRLLGPPLV